MVSFRVVNHGKKIHYSRKRHLLYVAVAMEHCTAYKRRYIVYVKPGHSNKRCRMAFIQIKIKGKEQKKMEVVHTLDIDGFQWEMQDVVARNDIAAIKQLMTAKVMPNIQITLNNGYQANDSYIFYVQKYGKLYMGLIFINDLSGNHIGTNSEAFFGKVNISLNTRVDAVGIEYLSSKPIRASIDENGNIHMQESAGVTNGQNCIRIPITWIEA